MIVLGIDPGVKGAIAFLGGPKAQVVVEPIPTRKSRSGREEYDVARIVGALRPGSEEIRLQVVAFLERGQPLPPMLAGRGAGGSGAISNYHRGLGRGIFEGILTALGITYHLVGPREWQDEMLPLRGGDTKARSIAAARRLFPGVSLYATVRSRKPSDGCADALLLAEFGRRKLATPEGRR